MTGFYRRNLCRSETMSCLSGRINDEGVKDYKDCSGNYCSVFIRVDVTFDASRGSCTKVDSCPLTTVRCRRDLRRLTELLDATSKDELMG